jgi:hypothetical protein
MSSTSKLALGWLWNWAARLRFPQLLALTAVLFVVDLFVPDLIPFVDEILLGLLTLLLAALKKRTEPEPLTDTPVIDVDPIPDTEGPKRAR